MRLTFFFGCWLKQVMRLQAMLNVSAGGKEDGELKVANCLDPFDSSSLNTFTHLSLSQIRDLKSATGHSPPKQHDEVAFSATPRPLSRSHLSHPW